MTHQTPENLQQDEGLAPTTRVEFDVSSAPVRLDKTELEALYKRADQARQDAKTDPEMIYGNMIQNYFIDHGVLRPDAEGRWSADAIPELTPVVITSEDSEVPSAIITGIDHPDFGTVLDNVEHVPVEGLDTAEADAADAKVKGAIEATYNDLQDRITILESDLGGLESDEKQIRTQLQQLHDQIQLLANTFSPESYSYSGTSFSMERLDEIDQMINVVRVSVENSEPPVNRIKNKVEEISVDVDSQRTKLATLGDDKHVRPEARAKAEDAVSAVRSIDEELTELQAVMTYAKRNRDDASGLLLQLRSVIDGVRGDAATIEQTLARGYDVMYFVAPLMQKMQEMNDIVVDSHRLSLAGERMQEINKRLNQLGDVARTDNTAT